MEVSDVTFAFFVLPRFSWFSFQLILCSSSVLGVEKELQHCMLGCLHVSTYHCLISAEDKDKPPNKSFQIEPRNSVTHQHERESWRCPRIFVASGFGTSNYVHWISVIELFQAGPCVSGDIGTVEKSQVVLHDSTLYHPAAPISIYDMRGYPLAARLSRQSVTQSVSYCRCRFTFPICEASSPPPPPAGGFALIYSAAGGRGRDVTSP